MLLRATFNYLKDEKIIMQFIPIILLLFYGFYEREFLDMSDTLLGKIFAFTLIIYYSKLNVIYGLLTCAFVIYFYSLYDDRIENFVTNIFSEQQNCVDGQLVHKGMAVRREMAEHVFPELEGTTISPCITTNYRVIAEDELKKPKNSRDFLTMILPEGAFSEEGFQPIEAPSIHK